MCGAFRLEVSYITLVQLLRAQHAKPADPTSPFLCVAEGFLSKDDEARVTSPEYDGLCYCYLLNVGDAEIVRYHNGTARYLNPVDVVFEARSEDSKLYLEQLYNGVKNSVWQVDELRTGVPLVSPFRVVGGYRPESRRQGFLETMLRLESSSL